MSKLDAMRTFKYWDFFFVSVPWPDREITMFFFQLTYLFSRMICYTPLTRPPKLLLLVDGAHFTYVPKMPSTPFARYLLDVKVSPGAASNRFSLSEIASTVLRRGARYTPPLPRDRNQCLEGTLQSNNWYCRHGAPVVIIFDLGSGGHGGHGRRYKCYFTNAKCTWKYFDMRGLLLLRIMGGGANLSRIFCTLTTLNSISAF